MLFTVKPVKFTINQIGKRFSKGRYSSIGIWESQQSLRMRFPTAWNFMKVLCIRVEWTLTLMMSRVMTTIEISENLVSSPLFFKDCRSFIEQWIKKHENFLDTRKIRKMSYVQQKKTSEICKIRRYKKFRMHPESK